MSPDEFLTEWRTVAAKDNPQPPSFRAVDGLELAALQLPGEAKQFLAAGIPEEASVYTLDLFPPLRRVYEIFAPGAWSESQKEAVQPFFVMGEDGGGNAVCIHELKGDIWLLDHEDFFQSREFINSGVRQFLEFSLLELKSWVGELSYADLPVLMRGIDSAAMQPEHTWLQIVSEQIEEERKSEIGS